MTSSLCYTSIHPVKTLQWLSVLFRVKTKVFTITWNILLYIECSLLSSSDFTSYIFPLIHSIPATLAALLFSNIPEQLTQQGLCTWCYIIPWPSLTSFRSWFNFPFSPETFLMMLVQNHNSSLLALLFPFACFIFLHSNYHLTKYPSYLFPVYAFHFNVSSVKSKDLWVFCSLLCASI